MGIPFNSIPSSLRVPFFAIEFDGSAAQQGSTDLPYRGLILGQKLTGSGTAVANSMYKVTSADAVATLTGRGSMMHNQAKAWFRNNVFTETWIGVLADNGAGVAQQGTITVTGPATGSGTISIYIGGQLVQVAVATGDVQNAVAAAINAAINANLDLIVTSTVATNVVTWTFRHKGATGGLLDVRANYQTGEQLPAGISLAFALTTAGTTNPILSTLIANWSDSWYHIIAHPYTDATSLTVIEAEMLSRMGPMRQIGGVAITAANGTISTLGTLGLTRNSGFSCILSQPGDNPLTPPWEFAAAAAAQAAFAAANDPARPFQTLALVGVLQPAEVDLYTLAERNLLLYDGIATTSPVAGGGVALERLVTTYQTNAAGSPDTAYLDANTPLTLIYLRYSFRTRMQSKYPRHKLADDGNNFGPGQPVMTPKLGKAEALSWFEDMQVNRGLVENKDQFKRDLLCVRSTSDPNRLEWLLPPDLINQLVVGAAQIQYRL